MCSKIYNPGSKTWRPKNSPLAIPLSSCEIYDKTKFHVVKGIDNAFELMKLCLVLEQKQYFTPRN